MDISEAEKICEDAFIHQYEEDFKKNTGKSLRFEILNRIKATPIIPITEILQMVDELTPSSLKDQGISFIKKSKKRDLTDLKKVFTRVSDDNGYTPNTIMKYLNVDHTTISYNLLIMRDVLRNPLRNPELATKYHKTVEKIKKYYEGSVQCNHRGEVNSESNLLTLFDPEQIGA